MNGVFQARRSRDAMRAQVSEDNGDHGARARMWSRGRRQGKLLNSQLIPANMYLGVRITCELEMLFWH